jgi:hypothetical protein
MHMDGTGQVLNTGPHLNGQHPFGNQVGGVRPMQTNILSTVSKTGGQSFSAGFSRNGETTMVARSLPSVSSTRSTTRSTINLILRFFISR